MEKINPLELRNKLSGFWEPAILAELNGQYLKMAKVLGEFVWHAHENEDEMFMVLSGEIEIQFRDKTITLLPYEMLVVPRGVEHKPVAKRETLILLFEPKATLNTGDVEESTMTRRQLKWIDETGA